MHSLGCRKGRPGAWLCCPQSHQALTGSGLRTYELMAVMVSSERGPTHLPSPSAEITSWDIPWQHLGRAPPDSGSAPAATRCSSKLLLSVPLLSWQHLAQCGHCQAALLPQKATRWLQEPWEGSVLLVWHLQECWEIRAVSLHVSPISAALPMAVQQLFHCQPLRVQYAENISHL